MNACASQGVTSLREGATCFDKKLTVPKTHNGKAYRVGSEFIVRVAKVVARVQPGAWERYGVSAAAADFTLA